ncbi:hypothetical protein BP6252_07612 [Coleophoma cylindrospora]|uniref:Cytochrome b561 domain-containing protein n=1 Tax=Coleophoma cylindrospora TaxID=1849047 RepID=A0A3D8RAH1_9HELO|nr:hypothetical protein BP6252_07612 [Coleophoma cylindrospora]
MAGYYPLILAHGVLAAITFLCMVPAAIMVARFYGRNPRWALRLHIYLQILTVGLTTVIFILGWMAVGPRRSLTNPHHGIGLAIYVLILVQAIGGWWIHKREKGKIIRKLPVKLVLHQWFGRAIALLGIAQVPLGLTLYGSPKYLFILYTLWMSFLLVWYFVLSYRAMAPIGGLTREDSHHGETVITERTGRSRSRGPGLLGGLAAGAALAALLGRRKRSRSRSQSRSRVEEVIPSRRGSRSRRDSGSYIDEKFERKKSSGGVMDTLFKGAAVLGAGALAKSWFDRRRNKDDEEYSSVAQDTPSRRNRPSRRDSVSDLTESSITTHRVGDRRTGGTILPGPGDPLMTATAISAADRPITPRPTHGRSRQNSFDSDSYSSTMSPSRRPGSSHGVRNGLLAGLGLGWFSKMMKDRRDAREMKRLEDERKARYGSNSSRYTGDGFKVGRRRSDRRDSMPTESSDLSTILTNPHPPLAPSSIPTVPVPLGAQTGSTIGQSRSRHDVTEHVSMPAGPPDPQGILHQDSGSEAYISTGGGTHRRHSSRRRREVEAAAAAAAASGLAAAEEERRRRERSRSRSAVASPPVSVKVKVHGDKDRNVTLRRLTEEEALAERASRKGQRRQRADSMSSLSGTDIEGSSRRYRRDTSRRRADSIVSAKQEAVSSTGPPVMAPLSPPDPPYAGGRRPKDSAYYSGKPAMSKTSISGSHGTWSEMSPSGIGSGQEDAAERRRRRRLERNQRQSGTGTGTVEFS